jgi:hypothetical protein
LRNNIIDNLNKKLWYQLTELFGEEYKLKDHLGKFAKHIELKEEAILDVSKIENN